MPAQHRLVVEDEDAGQRIDRVMARRLPTLSRSRCQRLIAQGQVLIEGVVVPRASFPLDLGSVIEVTVPDVVSLDDAPLPQDLDLSILYQDRDILVVNKPAGMAVHPAPGTPDGTVVNAVLGAVPDLQGIGGELRPGIVHRLDKDTTGILLVAKNDVALGSLQKQFRDRSVEKVYLALVLGCPKENGGRIDQALARHPKDRKRFTGRDVENRPDAREAVTLWKVRRRFEGAALIEVRPQTGRTHQIRVHLTEIGFPILGDKTYGKSRGRPPPRLGQAAKLLGHQALHALRISFEHPGEGDRRTYEAPLPPEWLRAVEVLEAGTAE